MSMHVPPALLVSLVLSVAAAKKEKKKVKMFVDLSSTDQNNMSHL
jgi:hypothetical protein